MTPSQTSAPVGHTADSRHPWTHSADFIRGLGPVGSRGVVLSRSDASQIRRGIAAAIGMTDEELAEKLSRAELAKTDADHAAQADRLFAAIQHGRMQSW